MQVRGASFLVACVAMAGCDAGVGAPDSRDWDAIEVPIFELAAEPEVIIGDREADPAHDLHFPTGALRLSDGTVVVADAQSRQVRNFSANGEHLRTVGGEGEGPGEFRSLIGLHRAVGDTVVAWDRTQRRATRIAPDGSVAGIHSVRLDAEDAGLDPDVILTIQDAHPTASGALLLSLLAEPPLGEPDRTDLLEDSLPVMVHHPDSGDFTLLGTFPGRVWFRHDRSVRALPFAPGLSIAAGREVIYVGDSRTDSIVRFTDRGEVLAPIPVPLSARPVTPDDVAWVRERLVERAVPDLRDRAQEVADAMTLPDTMPAYDHLRVDAEDRLWIRRAAGADRAMRQWVVVDAEGAPVARVLIPDGLELVDADAEHVVVHASGEFDQDLIRVHRLVPRAGGAGDPP